MLLNQYHHYHHHIHYFAQLNYFSNHLYLLIGRRCWTPQIFTLGFVQRSLFHYHHHHFHLMSSSSDCLSMPQRQDLVFEILQTCDDLYCWLRRIYFIARGILDRFCQGAFLRPLIYSFNLQRYFLHLNLEWPIDLDVLERIRSCGLYYQLQRFGVRLQLI